MKTQQNRARATFVTAFASGLALALTSCSPTGSSTEGPTTEDSGVAFGADRAEYHAAFADIEPILVTTQMEGAQGSAASEAREAYYEAITDWSDGKITFEVSYGGAIAPLNESDNALGDGRLDIVHLTVSYEPDIYPVYSSLADASFLGNAGPTGSMLTTAWMSEAALSSDRVKDELSSAGVRLLMPFTAPLANISTSIVCTSPAESAADLEGRLIAASGNAKVAVVQELGMEPVSMGFAEQYEALQRDVIGCAMTSPTAVDLGSLYPLTPYGTLPQRTSFPDTTLAVSEEFWDSLPLVAQQLFFDRLDVYISEQLLDGYSLMQKVIDGMEDAGGGISPASSDVQAAVDRAQRPFAEALSSAGFDVDQIEDRIADWTAIIVDELNYDLGTDVSDFAYQDGSVDTTAFIDRLYEDVLLQYRPGGN